MASVFWIPQTTCLRRWHPCESPAKIDGGLRLFGSTTNTKMTSALSAHLSYNLVRQESLKATYYSILTKTSATHKCLAEKWFTAALRALELQAIDQEILMDDPTRDIDYWEVDDTEEKLLEALDEQSETLLRSSDTDLYQLLIESIDKDDFIMIRLLLEDGRAALHDSKILLSVKSGKVMRILLEDGRVDPSVGGFQCLFEAIAKDRPEVLKELLSDGRIDVGAAETTHSLISKAIGSKRSIEIVRLLVNDERVDLTSPHLSYWPHLYAIVNGKPELLRLLLDCERYMFNGIDALIDKRNLAFLRDKHSSLYQKDRKFYDNINKECYDIFRNHPRIIAAYALSHPELFSN